MHDGDLPGLERAPEESAPPIIRRRYPASEFFAKENPTISVIITFHNQGKFVKECVESFLRQSITEPYEVIAVIDASQDNEGEIISTNYPGVAIYSVDFKNADKARNFGMEMAKGKLLAFFDGDDFAHGQYLQKLKIALDANPDADFVYARFSHDLFRQAIGKLPRCNIFEWNKSWMKYSPITNTPILIKADKAPKWDERLELMQDTAYGLAMLKNKLKGVHVREELWHYRMHGANAWSGKDVVEKKAAAVEILKKDYGFKDDKAEVTFISLISRDEVLDEYFGQIPNLGIPKKAHWFILLDSNSEQFIEKIKGYQKKYEKNFLSSRMFVTGETNLVASRDFEARGMRIANFIKIIINQAAERIGGTEFLFMVEDDTLAPKDAYKKLKPMITKSNSNAYVSGIECGRGFTKHTGICWLKENEQGDIIGREIPAMKNKGIVEIGGGGWYCWIGRARELQHFINTMPMRCFDGKMLGPDVMMIYDLKRMGYRSLTDLSIQCQHYDSRRKVWLLAKDGKGYDIDYFQDENKQWKMNLKEKVKK